jgi:hypothetical protein
MMAHPFGRELRRDLRQCNVPDNRRVSNGFYALVAGTATIPVSML